MTNLRDVLDRYLEMERIDGPDLALTAFGFALVNAAIAEVNA